MGLFSKRSTEAEFDIEGLDVYAIERDEDGDTLISYNRTEAVLGVNGSQTEKVIDDWWSCRSTDEQHRAFVARLTAKLAKRDQLKESE